MGRDVCFYDGQCGICRRTARWLNRLDWLRLLEFRDMSRTPAGELPVPPDAAMRGMPMRTADGRVLVGFPAVRRALLRTPLGFPLAVIFFIPGLSHIGCGVYNRIAALRAREVCALRNTQ